MGRTGFGAREATKLVLKRWGYSVKDIAVWEINEAFASVPIMVQGLGACEYRSRWLPHITHLEVMGSLIGSHAQPMA